MERFDTVMKCYVYKGELQENHYLYLPEEINETVLDQLPAALVELLGDLHLVVEFELTPQRELPQADSQQVLEDIQRFGFYLQMPKKDMLAEEEKWFN